MAFSLECASTVSSAGGGSGPAPVTSSAGRDPISKQSHVHRCPMGGAVLPRWSQTHPEGYGTSMGRWLGLQEELRPQQDHGGPGGSREQGPEGLRPLRSAPCGRAHDALGRALMAAGRPSTSRHGSNGAPCARILPNDLCFLTEATEASPPQPPSREDL